MRGRKDINKTGLGNIAQQNSVMLSSHRRFHRGDVGYIWVHCGILHGDTWAHLGINHGIGIPEMILRIHHTYTTAGRRLSCFYNNCYDSLQYLRKKK